MSEKQMLTGYQLEDQQLSESILNVNYYTHWTQGKGKIELFVTLDNGGVKVFKEYFGVQESIYPNDILDSTVILSNIKKFLRWYVENKFTCDISLFGDGWVDTSLFKDVISEIYSAFKGKLFIPKKLFITVPVEYFRMEENVKYLSNIKHEFEENLGIDIIYQIFALGGVIDGIDEDTYRSMFIFTAEFTDAEIISVIYQQDIDLWENNANWWGTVPSAIFNKLKFKVETSNKWSYEDINKYQHIVGILTEKAIQSSAIEKAADKKAYLQKLFINTVSNDVSVTQLGFNNFTDGSDFVNYGLHDSLCIRCGDLAVPLSKGLAYKELLIGKFGCNDSTITEFISECAERFIPKVYAKASCMPHCEACPYVGVCTGFDPAVSFQTYLDPFIAVRKHCDLQKTYINFMIINLKDLGAFDHIEDLHLSPAENTYFKDLLDYVEVTTNEAQ